MGVTDSIRNLRAGVARKVERRQRAKTQLTATRSGHDPVIVYSLPKTAGSSLHRSLQTPETGAPVVHVHQLSDAALASVGLHMDDPVPPVRPDKWAAMNEARRAIDDPHSRPVVLCTTRLPLARAISQFFQDWKKTFPWVGDQPVTDAGLAELTVQFRDRLPISLEAGDRWYHAELEAVTGVDVFSVPFPPGGWQRYQASSCDLAVARLEDLDRHFPDITSTLLGCELAMAPTNIGAAKPYRDHYRAFMDQLALTPDDVEAIRSTRVAQHFYAPDEVSASLAPFVGRHQAPR